MPKDTLSKKIRDLTRLLAIDTLPETVRQDKERALAALRDQKSKNKHAHQVSTMTQKYKMVKFVEGQKAERRLTAAVKKAKHASDEEKKDAQEAVRHCRIDLEYIRHYPVLEKYISLYKDVGGSEKVQARRDELWKMAETGQLRKLSRAATQEANVNQQTSAADTQQEPEEQESDDFFE